MSGMEQILAGAVSVLAGAVAYMFAEFKANFFRVEKALKECEEDREKLWERLVGPSNEEGK